ncbi:MAG: branched-chain amino acid ABC transporter permease [Thermodesulfobacteriota bacterium]
MDMKRDYYEDVQMFPSWVEAFWFGVLIVALLIFPRFAGNYYCYLANLIAINAIVAMGLNILVGYTGQVSLGHAGFFAIGAFCCAKLYGVYHWPFVLVLPLAGFVSAFFGFLVGLPALRLEGPYLTIATMGFGMAVTQIVGHWNYLGGRMGISIPKLKILAWELKADADIYYVIMAIAVIMTVAARNLVRTRVGRALIALRDSDIAAQTAGVNLTYYKTLAFAISAFYTGIAGALMAPVLGFISPENFNLIMSIVFLGMVVVGGLSSILGSIAGAALMTILQIQLSAVQDMWLIGPHIVKITQRWFNTGGMANIQNIIIGLIMVLIVIFEPMGINGFWLRTKRYFKTWPF